MLVLTRKVEQSFFIGDENEIIVKVLTNDGEHVRIGIGAPKKVLILREKLSKKQQGVTLFTSVRGQ